MTEEKVNDKVVSKEELKTLKTVNDKIKELIMLIGDIAVSMRILKERLSEAELKQNSLINDYEAANVEINSFIDTIYAKYEIDRNSNITVDQESGKINIA